MAEKSDTIVDINDKDEPRLEFVSVDQSISITGFPGTFCPSAGHATL